MIDSLFTTLPFMALFLLCFAALSGYRAALRLRGEAKARRRGVLLNLGRRAGPPAVVGMCVALVGTMLGQQDAGWVGALLLGGALSYGLTRMLQEMRATTAWVTAMRALAALAITLMLLYLRDLA